MKKQQPFAWPDSCQCALSLTFDDGLPSQLKTALPLMNKYGLCGTFYLNPRGDDWKDRYAPWHEAVRCGHEMGNHSIYHFGSYNMGGRPPKRALEDMSLEEVESDILEAQKRLETLFPEQKNYTYCYPNNESFVGRGESRQSYVPIVAKHFIAARGHGEIGRGNQPLQCDIHYLFSSDVRFMIGYQMIGLAERFATLGLWGILTFHGIQEGHLSVCEVYFEELLAHLDRNRDRIWTATVSKVAEYVQEWRGRIQ